MADVTVPLSRTYAETGKPFSALVFRQPRWQDFVDLGDIEEWQPAEIGADGAPVRTILIRHHDVTASYAERCLKEPNSAADLSVLDLPDVLVVHEAIRAFFVSARSSKRPPTGSSGGTGKGSETSGA